MMCPLQGLPWLGTALAASGPPPPSGKPVSERAAGQGRRVIPSSKTETHRSLVTQRHTDLWAQHPCSTSGTAPAPGARGKGRAAAEPDGAVASAGDAAAARAMWEPRGAALRAAAAALLLGAGACYCLWRLAAAGGRRGRRAAAARGPPADSSPPVSTHTMDVDVLQKLIHLLQATDDPLIQEQALITLSNSAAFSVNQDIIRDLDGLSVIGEMLSNCTPKVKEKALNALNNLSMNIKNQEEIQVFTAQVCRTVESAPLNSDVQLAGLRLLTNMSVTSDYHQKMINSIPCFFHLLSEGTERTQIHVLKVLVNLSANPAMTRHLLRAQVPSMVLLFDNYINRDILVRALAFAANLKKNMNDEEGTIIEEYSEDSIFFTLCRDSAPFAQRLASLLHHPDTEVKEQVVRILMQ
ncbi:armadillo repeat-containing protein 10-like [Poecile atricapillus]|uniref:armadillo repeat-containing protein 10-like n=1 Tax=Poecile atricapillus TaxID=48891 RepID=UPI0027388595|nr:armadillo repeat-containing protein 10-like [Poecile atricapillus]